MAPIEEAGGQHLQKDTYSEIGKIIAVSGKRDEVIANILDAFGIGTKIKLIFYVSRL
jgi:hypothetical protein